jgi:hypothetical protein
MEREMNKSINKLHSYPWRPLVGALGLMFLATGAAVAADVKVTLSGDQEVPPVQTAASGSGTIVVNADKSISGSVATKGINGTAAHIHEAAVGKSGGILVPLEKGADGEWRVPAGAHFTDEQYAAFERGDTYVNVHSSAHPGGEIRGQLKP